MQTVSEYSWNVKADHNVTYCSPLKSLSQPFNE